MTSVVRGLVSKKKIRFKEDGFDLDLTYITPRIIAMGFPSEGKEGIYRNPMKDVQRFFATRHPGHFKIYNLCSERKYDPKSFDNSCAHFPFEDHNPSSFETVLKVCADVDQFLKADEKNVVAIHCKAGKGRTGMMISAYLLWSKAAATPKEALETFGNARTSNGKGVTIPSQIRWVRYLHCYMKKYLNASPPKKLDFKKPPTITISKITLAPTAPDFDVGGGCDPYFKVNTMDGKVKVNWKKLKGNKVTNWKGAGSREFACDIPVAGEFRVVFYDEDTLGGDDKMFAFWMYTPFVTHSRYVLTKNDLDSAVKDKKCEHFKKDFTCTIEFKGVVEEKEEEEDEEIPPPPEDSDDDDDEDEDEAPVFRNQRKPKAKPADDDDDAPPPPPPEEDD